VAGPVAALHRNHEGQRVFPVAGPKRSAPPDSALFSSSPFVLTQPSVVTPRLSLTFVVSNALALCRSHDPASLSLFCAGMFPASWRQVRPATTESHVWRDEDRLLSFHFKSRLLSLTRLSLWLSTLGLASRRSALKSPSRYLEMPCLSGKEKFQHLAARRGEPGWAGMSS
jgi:hypothetical protein